MFLVSNIIIIFYKYNYMTKLLYSEYFSNKNIETFVDPTITFNTYKDKITKYTG